MESRIRLVALALAVGILLVAAVGPVLADCEWTGAGADKKWETADNWTDCGGDAPGLGADATFTVPESGWDTCEFNYPAYAVGDLSITGDSPTPFTFHVLDKDCLANSLDLNDYAQVVVEKVLRAEDGPDSTLAGTIDMDIDDIAAASPRNPEGYDLFIEDGWVDASDTRIRLTTASGAELRFDDLSIDVHDTTHGGGIRALELDGGTTTVAQTLSIRSEVDTGATAYIAKLHLASGTLTASDLRISAGQTATRRVELDIDSNMTVTTRTTMDNWSPSGDGGGEIKVDVLAGKTLDVGELLVVGPSVLKATSSGTGAIVGKLQSSD